MNQQIEEYIRLKSNPFADQNVVRRMRDQLLTINTTDLTKEVTEELPTNH